MAPSPDRPTVVRTGISRGAIIIGIIAGLGVGAYAVMAFTGREPAGVERDEVPASVRASPGGYRTYHFWHSGYHGGK
jgi:hypothetical protein